MGTWGPKIFQDDVAQDVRDEYTDRLRRGETSEEITRKLIASYAEEITDADDDDGPVFWFALADTQWEYGRLLLEVKEKALEAIESGTDLQRWQEENPKGAIVREAVLGELRKKLSSPQPPEKKVTQYKLYHCEWKLWDVFAYKLESNLARGRNLAGRYFLLQKVDEHIWHPGHTTPIVRVKITNNENLPKNIEEFDKLEYVQTWVSRYDETSDIKHVVDEFGFLPEFRVQVITTSKRVIPSKLIFIGNLPQTLPPEKEHIPEHKVSTPSVFWKEIEPWLLGKYFFYNLREAEIYQR